MQLRINIPIGTNVDWQWLRPVRIQESYNLVVVVVVFFKKETWQNSKQNSVDLYDLLCVQLN